MRPNGQTDTVIRNVAVPTSLPDLVAAGDGVVPRGSRGATVSDITWEPEEMRGGVWAGIRIVI